MRFNPFSKSAAHRELETELADLDAILDNDVHDHQHRLQKLYALKASAVGDQSPPLQQNAIDTIRDALILHLNYTDERQRIIAAGRYQ